jgi:hypothetical protein
MNLSTWLWSTAALLALDLFSVIVTPTSSGWTWSFARFWHYKINPHDIWTSEPPIVLALSLHGILHFLDSKSHTSTASSGTSSLNDVAQWRRLYSKMLASVSVTLSWETSHHICNYPLKQRPTSSWARDTPLLHVVRRQLESFLEKGDQRSSPFIIIKTSLFCHFIALRIPRWECYLNFSKCDELVIDLLQPWPTMISYRLPTPMESRDTKIFPCTPRLYLRPCICQKSHIRKRREYCKSTTAA